MTENIVMIHIVDDGDKGKGPSKIPLNHIAQRMIIMTRSPWAMTMVMMAMAMAIFWTFQCDKKRVNSTCDKTPSLNNDHHDFNLEHKPLGNDEDDDCNDDDGHDGDNDDDDDDET